MVRSTSFVFFALLGLISVSHAEEKKDNTPSIVINPSLQYSEGTFPKNTKWQGLYCDKNICEIKNTKVEVEKVIVDYIDDEKVPLDNLKVDGNPIALFPNGSFKIGNIPTWHSFNGKLYDFLKSNQFFILKNSRKWNMPWGKKPLALTWDIVVEKIDGNSIKYIHYSINDGKIKQFLFKTDLQSKYEGDTTPIIHWVGDLDGDGKLDLILDLPDDNCGYDERLFLSSKAEKGKLLKEVLKNEGIQPACGC